MLINTMNMKFEERKKEYSLEKKKIWERLLK